MYDAIEQMFSSFPTNEDNQFVVPGIGNDESEQNRNYQNTYDEEIFGKKRNRDHIEMVFKTENESEEYDECMLFFLSFFSIL